MAAIVAAAGFAALTDDPAKQAAPPRGEGPPGLERLRQAVPGNFGMEGPAAAADAAFRERAYPDTTISVAEMERSRDAFAASSHRPFPKARKKPGTWASIGPSEALYPFTQFRNSGSYVPNAYVAGGRTTSLALNEARCTQSRCLMYITPAGGGVWRTDRGPAGQAELALPRRALGINAAGAVTVDPHDKSGRTVWVGTGEANVCASGCVAGVGLYRSTNGGKTWQGPIGLDKVRGDLNASSDFGVLRLAAGTTSWTPAGEGMPNVEVAGLTIVPEKRRLYAATHGLGAWQLTLD